MSIASFRSVGHYRYRLFAVLGMVLLACGIVSLSRSQAQQQQPFQPKLNAVAKTELLMEGLIDSNFRGLEQLLSQQPKSKQAWGFARGQALLVAESGNLLMLRPPKTEPARSVWFRRATEMRDAATALAKATSQQNFVFSRQQFVNLANSCNRCHRSFRVQVEVTPFRPPQAKQGRPPGIGL